MALVVAAPMMQFDEEKMQLILSEDRVAKIVLVPGPNGKKFPWFQAKPIVLNMGYTESSTRNALNKLPEKCRKTLLDLVNLGGSVGATLPPHNDLIAMYISEPGLYELCGKSELPRARPFQDWVYEDVLPKIRDTGSYSMNNSQALVVEFQALREYFTTELAKVKGEIGEEVAFAVSQRISEYTSYMMEVNEGEQMKLKDFFTEALTRFKVVVTESVVFALSQRLVDVRDGVIKFLEAPTGGFLDALRRAVKKPALKTTTDSNKFPDEQRVTQDEERFVVSLSVVLTDELTQRTEQHRLPTKRAIPSLTYGAWKKCRALIGSRCLALRKKACVSKPLLWSNSADAGRSAGGGQHYVYLSESKYHVSGNSREYIRKVLNQKLKNTKKSITVEEHIRSLIASTPPEQWPTSTSCIDAFAVDAAQEKLGHEMDVEED